MRITAALVLVLLGGCALKDSAVQTDAETRSASIVQRPPASWPAWVHAPAWFALDARSLSEDELRARGLHKRRGFQQAASRKVPC